MINAPNGMSDFKQTSESDGRVLHKHISKVTNRMKSDLLKLIVFFCHKRKPRR